MRLLSVTIADWPASDWVMVLGAVFGGIGYLIGKWRGDPAASLASTKADAALASATAAHERVDGLTGTVTAGQLTLK